MTSYQLAARTAAAVDRILATRPQDEQSATVTALESLTTLDRAVWADPVEQVATESCHTDSAHGWGTVQLDEYHLCPPCANSVIHQSTADVVNAAVRLVSPPSHD